MPFRVIASRRKKGQWDVENADTGEVKNTRPYRSKSKAEDYSGALNVNSEDVNKSMGGANSFSAFAQLQKVDVTKRQVWGVATAETPDRSGEIMDYSMSKANFSAWSDAIAKATDGKSLGNLRVMHQPIAAGKVIHFEPRDASRDIYIGAEVVDGAEWEKVLKGVYTGFSIGGAYGKKWRDGEYTRYEAKPSEISLVDYPCHPGATFEFIKADGQTEMMKFTGDAMEKVFPPAKGKDEQPAADGDEQPAEKIDALKAKLAELIDAGKIDAETAAEIEKANQAEEKSEPEQTQESEQETPKQEQPAAGESGQTAHPAGVDKTAIRAELLALLEELGLVERVDDGAMKAVQSGDLKKAMQENELQKAEISRVENTLKSELSKLAGEFSSGLATVNERLGKVTGMGPIIAMRPGEGNQGSDAIIADLKQRQASTSNPMEKQQIGNLIAQLEMQRATRQ